MPNYWIQENFFRTIKYFNSFINQQASEACYLFLRRWVGPYRTGRFTSFEYNDSLGRYETILYRPTVPPSNGKPRLRTLKLSADGREMISKTDINLVTEDNYYYVRLYNSPKDSTFTNMLLIGFNEDYDPRDHVIEYAYEEICHCIDAGEESFRPDARCLTCYGVGFVGGYDQYYCSTVWSDSRIIKPANTVLVRIPITSETVRISRFGAQVSTTRKSWVVSEPIVHDWDLLIRPRAFGARVNEDYITNQLPDERYFINDWENSSVRMSYDLPVKSQNRGVTFPPLNDVPDDPRGVVLHQRFTLSEIQPTNIVYQLPYVVDYPGEE